MADWIYDELVLAADLVRQNDWRGVRAHQQSAMDLSQLLIAAPFHDASLREPNFRSPNSVQRKTFDIATSDPVYQGKQTRGNKLDRVVLEQFQADPQRMTQVAAEIRSTLATGRITSIPVDDPDWDDVNAPEGRILWVKHRRRERDPRLRYKKIAQIKSLGQAVACEVCKFNFETLYGDLGRDYIEVHHVLPLHASGPVTTALKDLALVCSNCHRMIHRSKHWLTPEKLREVLRDARSSKAPSPQRHRHEPARSGRARPS